MRKKQGYLLLSLAADIVLEVLTSAIRQENKRHIDKKKV